MQNKNKTKLGIITLIAISTIITGCGDDSSSGGGGRSAAASVAAAFVPNAAAAGGTVCSVTKAGSVATVSCSDGTSATINDGTNGLNGTNGTNGVSAPKMRLRDANNALVGTHLINFAYGNSIVVMDDVDQVTAQYSSPSGQLGGVTLYYQSTGCTGTPLVSKYIAQNSIVQNAGATLWKVSTNVTASIVSQSQKNVTTGACANSAIAADVYSQAISYSNSSIPLQLAFPVRAEQF